MSLRVDVFVLGDDGEIRVLDTPECCEPLAGFESWRSTVWGSAAVRALGAQFFVVLADGDLTIAPDQVPDFLRECATLRASIGDIAPTDSPRHPRHWYLETISARLANIQIAAGYALGIGGGVMIW